MAGSVTVVVGTQWGDEGKGKIVDHLASGVEYCVRFQGGGNAGHTVINQFGEFKLHLVPSGVFNPQCLNILGTGTVIDPAGLLEELEMLQEQGISTEKILISDRAHVVMPYHKLLDRLDDESRGAYRVGTTGRGIGPAYVDKYARLGIRVADLLNEQVLRDKLSLVLLRHNIILTSLFHQSAFEIEPLVQDGLRWGQQLRARIVDTVPILHKALREEKPILLEGQLSAMKDIDWGSYPFVTSSNPTAAGAAVGAGLPPAAINRIVGVAKAFSSQVGTGPMPTELKDAEGNHLRELGGEYGATTGRARRIGWFDAVITRYVTTLNGCTELALTKLDVLDTYERIPVCTAYRYRGELLTDLPDPYIHEECEPVYEYFSGWLQPTTHITSVADLPYNARAYADRLAELSNVRLHSIGVGPRREQTLLMAH